MGYREEGMRFIDELNSEGIYNCACGARFTEIHHAWERSKSKKHATDPRNFVEICRECHSMIHDQPKEKWTKAVWKIDERCKRIREYLENEQSR